MLTLTYTDTHTTWDQNTNTIWKRTKTCTNTKSDRSVGTLWQVPTDDGKRGNGIYVSISNEGSDTPARRQSLWHGQ